MQLTIGDAELYAFCVLRVHRRTAYGSYGTDARHVRNVGNGRGAWWVYPAFGTEIGDDRDWTGMMHPPAFLIDEAGYRCASDG